MLINHDRRAKNKDTDIIAVQKWTILFDLFLSILIVEKITANRNNKTWIIRLGRLMKSGTFPSKKNPLKRLRVPSIISKKVPIMINIKGANNITN